MSRVTRRSPVLSYRDSDPAPTRKVDHVAVEEPLEIRIGGEPYQVTMRTPGADIDLVHGLLLSENVITTAEDVATIRYCDGVDDDGLNTYNVVDVTLTDAVPPPAPELRRGVTTTSACGVCGARTVDAVLSGERTPLHRSSLSTSLMITAPELLQQHQRVFARTGGTHAVGLLSAAGELLCVREDVGRHNAADKVVGWALREGRIPLQATIMVVSARASFELVHKAVRAGAEALVAVSAPTSLAVELADRAGLTLAAFVRRGGMNVYTHADRLDGLDAGPDEEPADLAHVD